MSYDVKIIADSVDSKGNRITTMQLCYPRWIHSQLNTHRVFSRNASSSRAIPIKKLLAKVDSDNVNPLIWGSNRAGMKSIEELPPLKKWLAKRVWNYGRRKAKLTAYLLSKIGLHKQWSNRGLEPYSNISVIVTSTEWENFFNLRCHEDAQPEIQHLANLMRTARNISKPTLLKPGEWHLPYISEEEKETLSLVDIIKCCSSRCARVSYLNHDGKKPSLKNDLELFDKLTSGDHIHGSALEHCAIPLESLKDKKISTSNFKHFVQGRKFVELNLLNDINSLIINNNKQKLIKQKRK